MINSLLALARVKVKSKDMELVVLEDLLVGVLADMKFAISDAGGIITHDPLPVVKGVKALLTQVFANLLGNGIKYHGAELPKTHIGVIEGEQEWTFSFRDNGIGFDPQFAEAIFTIFRRLHTQEEYPGTGVGLSICKKIVEEHGGKSGRILLLEKVLLSSLRSQSPACKICCPHLRRT